jgi:hypothetical protein
MRDVNISQIYLFMRLVLIKKDFNYADYSLTGPCDMRRRNLNPSCKKKYVVT